MTTPPRAFSMSRIRLQGVGALALLGLVAAACTPTSGGASARGAEDLPTAPNAYGHRLAPVPAPAEPGKNVPAIKVNTVGYPRDWTKVVVFNVEPVGAVVRDAKGAVALTVTPALISERGVDAASKDPVWQVDLSALTAPGTYVAEVGKHRSDPFTVGDGVYSEFLELAQKHFYFQRCRTALTAPYAVHAGGSYLRDAACHDHDEIGWDLEEYPEKKHRRKLVGGWHDAGNFDMYVSSTAPTAQALLLAFELRPDLFRDRDLNIPESGNGLPDLLDEVRWGLDWVLAMQDESGGFHQREALMGFSDPGSAAADKGARWVSGLGTASTAKGVAVLALASRVYAAHDAKYAARCADASRAGWKWLRAHPERLLVDGHGSEQPLWDDGADVDAVTGARLNAAAEVWRAFREPEALAEAERLMKERDSQASALHQGAWGNLSRWGLIALAQDPKTPAPLRTEARQRVVAAAELLRDGVEKTDGYRCATEATGYYWGHNSNLMEKAHVLAMAGRLAPEKKWTLEAARDQLHWILGRNPNGYSMVTRVGKGPDVIYHAEWGAADKPVPGYLIGGPNAVEMKELAPGAPAKAILWESQQPLRSGLPAGSLWHAEQTDLWDGHWAEEENWDTGWWTVTEPDIYYNANLVLAAAAVAPHRP